MKFKLGDFLYISFTNGYQIVRILGFDDITEMYQVKIIVDKFQTKIVDWTGKTKPYWLEYYKVRYLTEEEKDRLMVDNI